MPDMEVRGDNRLPLVPASGTVPRSAHGRWLRAGPQVLAPFLVAVGLSACTSPPVSVRTSADIPSGLGVRANPSATANYAGRLIPPSGCQSIGVAVFSAPGRPLDEAVLPSASQS